MPLHTILFGTCLIMTTGYALLCGGAPERIVAAELAVAAVATEALALKLGFSFQSLQWTVFALDTALLVVLMPVALRANRYWPLWIAAIQLDTISMHGVRAFDPALRPPVYFAIAGYAAYPILILLAVGTLRHRDRVARTGIGEPAWTH